MLRDYVKMSQPSQTSATRERMLRKHKLKADQLVGIVRHSGGIQDFWREDCVGSMSCLGLKYALGMLPQIHVAMQQRVVQQCEQIQQKLQKQLLEERKQQFHDWMEQAVKGSGREGHAFLRRAEALRPFQTQALAQRLDSTRQYWKKFWTEEDISRDLTEIEMQVRTLAIEQAQSLKPISSTQLYKQVQLMGNKKPGPDQWTPAELRKLHILQTLRQIQLSKRNTNRATSKDGLGWSNRQTSHTFPND